MRNAIERCFSRLKQCRRNATRYDRSAYFMTLLCLLPLWLYGLLECRFSLGMRTNWLYL